VTAAMPVTAEAVRPVNVGQAGTGRGTSLVERGYVHARFGGVPVLVGPELAAQLKTIHRTQPSPEHGSQQ
jgi:hypothetical protein